VQRPPNARALLESLEALNRASLRAIASVTAEEISARLSALLHNPLNEDEAATLESTVDAGADPVQLAQGFHWISQNVDVSEGPNAARAQKRMVFRAARLFESSANQPESAEQLYAWLLQADPKDESAARALERVRRRMGKFEELIEGLLERVEEAENSTEKARLWAQIGRIYEKDQSERDQALVAYVQAFCEDPFETVYADDVERVAGNNQEAWQETLASAAEASQNAEISLEARNRLLVRMARWYGEKVVRPDLALSCLNGVLGSDPSNDSALEAMTAIYKKAQQWGELGQVLLKRAEAASPGLSRDLRTEAAEIAEKRLGDATSARDLYESVLSEDPGHEQAAASFAEMLERLGETAAQARVLERRAVAQAPPLRQELLCKVAELYDEKLGDTAAATRLYQQALAEDPALLDALRGLDRIYSKTARHDELLKNLEEQLELAVTPRQKIVLLERIAGLYEEEHLDHRRAAESCEQILEIDPNNDNALAQLGRHYRMLERWTDLVVMHERRLATLSDPENKAEVAAALGRVLSEQLGQRDRALEAYEQALEALPSYGPALEAAAKLRAELGQGERALEAIETLAEDAKTPEARAEQYLRAARLLESQGQLAAALERYKWALDAKPDDPQLSKHLRQAYVQSGDGTSAVELLEREIAQTKGDRAKAQLAGEMAQLCREQLKDEERAEKAARQALELDPTNLSALLVLGHMAYDAEKYADAIKRFDLVVSHAGSLERADAMRLYRAYIDALSKTGSSAKALSAAEQLLQAAPEDLASQILAAAVNFEHGNPDRALALYTNLLERYEDDLTPEELFTAYLRQGESYRKTKRYDKAVTALGRALDVDPMSKTALEALAGVYEDQQKWQDAIRVRYRALESVSDDDRIELLLQIGDLAAQKLRDQEYAAKSYLTALSERPKDRKVMMKLMQLYSEGKDWSKLIKVIVRMADLVDEDGQKAKYLHTASMVASRELDDPRRAIELLDQALALDPELEVARLEAIQLKQTAGDDEGVKDLLKDSLSRLDPEKDREKVLDLLDELERLYAGKLNRVEQAIAVAESGLELEPDDAARQERLAALYMREPARYFEQAQELTKKRIDRDPFRPEPYQQLRHLYTSVRRPDGAWCACQALFVLNRAEPDEVRFFNRMRSEGAAAVQDRLTEEDWLELVVPEQADSLLTALFASIENAVVAARGQPLAALGYTEQHRVNPTDHPYGAVYALAYAADVFQVTLPPIYQNTNDPGAISYLTSQPPALVCGQYAFNQDVPPQVTAYLAARALSAYRPGFLVRQLVPNSTALKAWLFAAVKLIAPTFPVAADLEGPVREALEALKAGVTGRLRDHLAQVVTRLLEQAQALDLKRWMAGADLALDRAGFILADDLGTAIELIRGTEDPTSAVPTAERVKYLIAYSVSPEYLALRERLGLAIGA
jgi:tetratricopeptide (TPR) repeat protein